MFKRSPKFNVCLLLLSLLAILSCDSDRHSVALSDQEYFPLLMGLFWTYNVEESHYTPYNVEEKFNYQIQTIVTDSFQNAAADYTYILSRSKRATENDDWLSLDTWTIRKNDQEVIITESNIPFVRLTFPVRENREWNANRYNDEESSDNCEDIDFASCDLFSYNAVKPYQLSNGLTFDATVEVKENEFMDIFTRQDIRLSVYAKDVGLIHRELTKLEYCTSTSSGVDCFGKQLIEGGTIMKLELIDYGRQ